MNSIIRQHHLRVPDVKAFLRTFERNKPLTPDEWAVKESALYEPGYLIFCLEPVAAAAGLSTFSKRGEEQGETYRVKDLCVVISKDDGKCVAVIVSPSAYEFRVLDGLLLEKAMKAILDGRDFNYLAARPVQKLNAADIKALYKLGSEYAKSGSRRTLAVEGSTVQEPATALLAQLGAKLSTQVGKQLIDIGSICHMIFTPEGRQEDKSKSLLKSCFVPVRADDDVQAAAKPQPSGDGQSLYSIDPLADVANLQENYSSEAGNIDLSALAPEPPLKVNYEAPLQPLLAGPGEPSSNFGDFGMGLLSALAPQQPAPPQPAMSFESLAEGGRSSDLPSLPFSTGPAPSPDLQNMDTLPPSGPSTSFTGLSSMDTPMAFAAPKPGSGNGQAPGTVPEWFIMSHEAVPAASDQAAAASESTPSTQPPPNEDYSQQFLSDWQQGNAGQASISAAEKEFEAEKRLKTDKERGKEQRLKDYFGEEHFQKYVKGEIPEPDIEKVDAWQLDPSQYKSEPTEHGPNFDSDIFANAGRSTLETNPDAIVHEPPREEITGPPPDPSWAIPTNVETAPSTKVEHSFDNMLSAGGALAVPEKIQSLDEPGAEPQAPAMVPNLSILEALQPEPVATSPAISPVASPLITQQANSPAIPFGQELGPMAVAADSPGQTNSLFDRLTGELSKDQPENITIAQTVSQSNLAAVEPNLISIAPPPSEMDASQSASQPAPATINWTPPAAAFSDDTEAITSGPMWPAIPPTESLFAASKDDVQETIKESPFTAAGSASEYSEAAADATTYSESGAASTALPISPGQSAAQGELAAATSAEETPAEPTAATTAAARTPSAASFEPPVVETTPEPALGPESYTSHVESPPADIQQPRVRPRDYSSPLRASKSLGAADPLSPMTPHPKVTRQNITSPLPSSQPAATMPPAKASAPSANVISAPTEEPAQAQYLTPAATTEVAAEPTATPATGSAPAPVVESPPTYTAAPTTAPVSVPVPISATTAGSQDARLMMNEMASLMSKLEMQVAKAANKMASRAEELRARLSQQVDVLVKEAQEVEKQAENNLVTLASELKSKLDTLSTEVHSSLAKNAQNAQQSVEEIAQSGWDKLESEQTQLSLEITRAAEQFRAELAKLNSTVSGRLDSLIENRNTELVSLSDSILAQLKESHDAYSIKVAQRFDRFEQRMNEETASISSSLDRNMRSMVEEIETSLERACEKLKNTKFELEQTVSQTIAVSDMAIAQKAKYLLTESLLPRLNEQKEIIRTMISDMAKQIANQSNSGLDSEVAKLEQGAAQANKNLRKIADECLEEVEMTGRGVKTGLEDHFKRVSNDLMVRTREVGDKIRETERRIADSEYALKGLAEASTVDSEPELAEERNHAVSKLANLKQEASKQLATSIEQNLDGLDAKGEHLFGELSNKRSELTSQVRDSAESNIGKIRQALQEAMSAIQSAREKHME